MGKLYYTVGQAKYWYEIDGEGVPIVMLHGFTGSSKTWQHVKSLFGSGNQIIVIDLPGHGKTKASHVTTMQRCCADLHMLFQFLGLGKIHLVGYSMGGRTALSFALHYPAMIQSLILESSSPGIANEAERRLRIEADKKLAERIERDGVQAFVDYWQDIPLFASQKSLPSKVKESIRRERVSHTAEGLAQSLRAMGTGTQESWWSELESFERPVQLVVGALDTKFIATNKKMHTLLKSSKMIVCEHAGHAIHVEKPEIFGKLVREFIDSVTD
ncbi:2-succinyl-6-hydroxy-2,4-cyclohexadiene-1-carboxylate synthase [Oceanobacillus sp. FSL K6-2867]|uniref:2-succinyl-6-hydroxy-2, 4-cyclohexadiene-1-carboxylate synthase n=1 Tax=Oceanobacillus sp. FSL K6-2867 TaxID=2954748 RepID=UPI0030DB8C72